LSAKIGVFRIIRELARLLLLEFFPKRKASEHEFFLLDVPHEKRMMVVSNAIH